MIKVLQSCAAASLTSVLVACGGGGGDGPPAPAGPLSAFAGTWVGECKEGVRDRVTATVLNPEATQVKIENFIDYFAAANCSGDSVAYLYYSGASATGLSKGQTNVNMPGSPSQSVKAETVEITVTPGRVRIWGSNVNMTSLTQNGVTTTQWCVGGVAGKELCFDEADVVLTAGSTMAGFYVNGDTLYSFQDDDRDGKFDASGTFKKKPTP